MNDRNQNALGAVIRLVREARGLSRQDLVAKTGDVPNDRLGPDMLAKVEQGRRGVSPRSLRRIARGLSLSEMQLSTLAARWEDAVLQGEPDATLRVRLLSEIGSMDAPKIPAPETERQQLVLEIQEEVASQVCVMTLDELRRLRDFLHEFSGGGET